MKFGDVLSAAVYGISGYVADCDDVADAERVLRHNLPVLGAFEQVVVPTNYREGCPADFYFLNAVSYGALRQHDFQLSLFTDNFFFPQTTFYAINTGACDTLYDRGRLDDAWRQVSAIPNYNDRIWEHLPGWSCERQLRDCVLENGLRRCHLMSDEQWQRVLAVVVAQRISDCSFKGLSINGICHGQGLTDPAAAQVI